MFNIFEQYWTLLIAAVIAFVVVLQVRSIFPEKRTWWQWLIPAGLAVTAFACDGLVKTDLEKVLALLKAGMIAVEAEDVAGIDKVISPDYRDSHHATKEHLMRYCRLMLSEPLVAEIKMFALAKELSPPQATVTLTVRMRFDEQSFVYKNYKPTLMMKSRLHLQKQPNKTWRISSAEPLEIDLQPVTWRTLR